MGYLSSYPPPKELLRQETSISEGGERPKRKEDEEDVFTSAAVGYVTDNWMLGTLAGGSLLGGMLGDALND